MKEEEKAKYNPELKPKTHDLIISYWVGDNEVDFGVDQKIVEAIELQLPFVRCGSGFDFEERRRDLEFTEI